jgi:eukaryotic-like serine/threonine-protein kinase
MGSVWVAFHVGLNTEIALKFIDVVGSERESLVSRFRAEALAIARVKSPHVIGVMDYGYDEGLRRPFLAMELLAGESLGARLEREGRLPLVDVVKLVCQACRGLGAAHRVGIVHRDIKPDNMFLCPDEGDILVKLLDFGVAKLTQPLGEVGHHTTTGALIGTPLYMSPEQALGGRLIDHRADLFSLGTVAYHCLTGQPPFDAAGLGELIVQVSSRPPRAPRELCPALPLAVERWLGRALEKPPERRFQSAREMADELLIASELSGRVVTRWSLPRADMRGVHGQVASPIERTLDDPSLVATPVPATFSGTASTRRGLDEPTELPLRRSPLAGVSLVGAVLLAGAAGFSLLRRGPDAPAEVAASSSLHRLPGAGASPSAPASTAAPAVSVAPAPPPSASAAPSDAGSSDSRRKNGAAERPPRRRWPSRGTGFQL